VEDENIVDVSVLSSRSYRLYIDISDRMRSSSESTLNVSMFTFEMTCVSFVLTSRRFTTDGVTFR
jgi:hypothetical protein